VSVKSAPPLAATPAQVELETELVHLALRAAEHHPILKAVYAGPLECSRLSEKTPGHQKTF
jgi:hypothetical protein